MSSKKLLVVEDSFDLRELLGAGLVKLGCEPILAENGRASLTCLADSTPRVILMDMGLGDMIGFELAAVLKQHHAYNKDTHSGDDRLSRSYGPAALCRGRLR